MEYTFKALLIGSILLSLTTFSNFKLSAQNYISPEFVGTWVLDSVQVKEVMPDNVIQKTVLPDEDSNFNSNWIRLLTFVADKQLLYIHKNNNNSSNAPTTKDQIPYTIEDIKENTATLIINRTADYRVLKIQLSSKSALSITQSFTTTNNNTQNINVSWKMYYHKSNKQYENK